jgi:hypothetical protein
MSTLVGLDRAVEYITKLETFRAKLESQDAGCINHGDIVKIERGRKFDKVFIHTNVQNLGRYMVDRNSWVIYGIKSWAQINERRTYGTLDTIDQYDWSPYYAVPTAGTDAERLHRELEAQIAAGHKRRGRPKKTT